jgi:hypothetical protein
MRSYQVRDGSRLISFDGDLLGHISSARPGTPRWTEMSIYRTKGNSYVLEKVGRSVVTHMEGCVGIIGFQAAHPGDDPDIGYTYHDCVPDEYDFTKLLVEEDRFWAIIAEDPERIVEALYRRREGVRHLPRISLDLLGRVSDIDPSFGSSWRVEHIA